MDELALTLAERIDADLKQAMRDRNETVKLTLRALKTAILQARTSGKSAHEVGDAEILDLIRKEAKRRIETAAEFEKLGAPERQEHAVLVRYLPPQLSTAEVEEIARAVIAELGASSLQQLGQVMAAVLARTGRQADGKTVNQIVRSLLQ